MKHPHSSAVGYALLVLLLTVTGCQEGTAPIDGAKPENYLTSDYNDGLGNGQTVSAVWVGNRIYSTWPIRYYELDDNFKVSHDSVPFAYTETNSFPPIPDSVLDGFTSIRSNSAGTKLLAVKQTEVLTSIGSLEEIDTRTWLTSTVIPASRNIASALYLSPDSIIYLSEGSATQPVAGYYLYVRSIDEHVLLTRHYPVMVFQSEFNGFDYSKRRNTLIIPIARDDDAQIIELDLETLRADTLPVAFEPHRRWLHLRYSADGSRVLYSSYAGGASGTELGILDLENSFSKTKISRPAVPDAMAISLFPEWSPSETHIVLSASRMGSQGSMEWLKGLILKLP